MLSLPDFKEKKFVLIRAQAGDKVSFQNDNVVVKNFEKTLLQWSCHKISLMMIAGNLTITNVLLQQAIKFGFPIVLLSYNFKPYQTLAGFFRGNVILREKQYQSNDGAIAKNIVINKINNQVALLKKERSKKTEIERKSREESIASLKEYVSEIEKISLKNEQSYFQTLLGFEGQSSKIYFKEYFGSLPDTKWNGRKPRVKNDIINLLLDIGYTYLFNLVEALLQVYGFDVYKGVYHKCFYERKSLVCDLVEPFRGIIDNAIRTAYSRNQINTDDFFMIKNMYQLKYSESKKYHELFLETLNKNKTELFNYIQKYYRAFIRERPVHEFPTYDIT